MALLVICAAAFSINIWGYSLWPPDEPRFAQVAREMLDSGDYLTPRINGEPYQEKPPLLFWAIALVSLPFGDVSEASARLPSVLAALVAVGSTYLLAARLYGRRVAFWSAMVLAANVRFWWEARTARTDMLLTACLAAALFVFWLWHAERRNRWLVLFYGAVAAAVYTKGPPAVLFPFLALIAFYWGRPGDRRQAHPVVGLLAVAAIIALWLIPARAAAFGEVAAGNATTAVASNLFRQTVGRFFLGVSKPQPPWHYLLTLPVDLLPWSLLLPWTVHWTWKRRREDDRMRFLLAWTIPAFAFFSISIGKRAMYLLPLWPALAIVIARSALALAANDRVRARKWMGAAWSAIVLALGLIPFALLATKYRQSWSLGLLVFSLAAGLFGILTLVCAARTPLQALPTALAAQFLLLASLATLTVFPVVDTYKSAAPICGPLRKLARAGVPYRLYSLGFTREEYVFYARHFHEPALTKLLPAGDEDLRTRQQQQKRVRRSISSAVENVPVASFRNVTDTELDALRSAVESGFAQTNLDAAVRAQLEAALADALLEFDTRFRGRGPAYFFVQEEDWRWMLPLHEPFRDLPVVSRAAVGSRAILLVANGNGARILQQKTHRDALFGSI